MTTNELTAERLAEMLEGLEGVTPGPWADRCGWAFDRLSDEPDPFYRIQATGPEIGAARQGTDFYERCAAQAYADAAHIARCDPDTIRALIALAQEGLAGREATHRHVKRGTEYVLIGIGKMQSESWLINASVDNHAGQILSVDRTYADNAEVAIYRSVDDGSLWVRPREEFEDGRFAALEVAP